MQRAARVRASCAAICWIAGCAAPGGPPPEAPPELTGPSTAQLEIDALEREADGHAALGRRDLAAPLYARSIALRAAMDGAPAPAARVLMELAVVEHERGYESEAEHFYRRALAATEEAPDGSDPDPRPLALANLGWLLGERAADHARAERTAEAIDSYQQALAVWEQLQPASDEVVAETLANLALVHRARGEHGQARQQLARALPLYEQRLAPDDPTLQRVRALAAADPPRAQPAPARAAEPDPAWVARDLDREGAAHLDRREYLRARVLLERAVSIHERGVTAPVELGASLSYLGRAYAALGERENARYVLQRSLALLEPALGRFDPLTLTTRASLENLRAQSPASIP